MKNRRAFKKVTTISSRGEKWAEYTVTNGNDIIHYTISDIPFGFYSCNAIKIGYLSIKGYIKTMKKRSFIGEEISNEEQRESLLTAFIALGYRRIEVAKRICTGDFIDVCKDMGTYLGIGLCDAQGMISEKYVYDKARAESSEWAAEFQGETIISFTVPPGTDWKGIGFGSKKEE